MLKRTLVALGLLLSASVVVLTHTAQADPLTALDLSAANRRAPMAGLYDWSKAGYRGGASLPTEADINPSCRITPSVTPNDGLDDSAGLQAAID